MKGSEESECEDHYYGIFEEVVRVEYPREPHKQCVLFRCDWFGNAPRGTHCLKLVYIRYQNGKRDKSNWWVVVPNKPDIN